MLEFDQKEEEISLEEVNDAEYIESLLPAVLCELRKEGQVDLYKRFLRLFLNRNSRSQISAVYFS